MKVKRLNLLPLASLLLSCSSAEYKHTSDSSLPAQSDDIQKMLLTLSAQIQAIDNKVNALSAKIDASTTGKIDAPPIPTVSKTQQGEVLQHPSDESGVPIPTAISARDPETGFINDDAVQSYRQALLLFQGRKYPEATLAFSSFLEKFPDHTFAGSAQYYIGASYLKQKEYRLAVKEFERVLTSYDQSIHIAETLRDITSAEEELSKFTAADKHRQLLSSLFSQSPAAKNSFKPSRNPALETQPSLDAQKQTTPTKEQVEGQEKFSENSFTPTTIDQPPVAPDPESPAL